jgi:predicted MFS family arabinose efflux permease
MNSAQFNLSRVMGPAMAGVALKYVGSGGCFFLNGISFLALLFALPLLRINPFSPHATEGFWKPLRDGFRYIREQRNMAMLMMLVALASLCAVPYVTLMPSFARDVLHLGPLGLGYLMGASGVGALAGAFLLARFGGRPRQGARLLRGFLTLYISLLVFCASRSLPLCLLALFFTGAAMVTAVSSVNNLLQKHVADQMRGRVMSMHATAFLGFAPIGSLIAGSLAHAFGVAVAIAALCAVALVLTLLVPLLMPEIQELA